MQHNKIHSAYFREQKQFYTVGDFARELEIDTSLAQEICEQLSKRKFIKPTTQEKFNYALVDEELDDGFDEIFDDDTNIDGTIINTKNGFVFDFVGIAYVKNCVLKCYPKYIEDNCSQKEFDLNYKAHFKTVLDTIKKYTEENEQKLKLYTHDIKSEKSNILSVMLYILTDYFENGIYTNQKTIIETNGEGEIDWDTTINETFAVIKNNTPYYFDLQTINTVDNDEDFIRLLHECIVSDCSRFLSALNLLDMFDLSEAELTSLTLVELDDKEVIKARIEKELKSQYVTKKQNLLKTLYTYVDESKNGFVETDFSFYGVHKFYAVWEKACAAIFNNVLDEKIINLETKKLLTLTSEQDKNKTLKDFIEKVSWHFDGYKSTTDDKGLEPDIISIFDNRFYILDGKYYFLDHKTQTHKPGVQDIIKQFAYHKMYFELLQFTSLTEMANAFLFPKKLTIDDQCKLKNIGTVKLNNFQDYGFTSLCDIQIVELNPKFVFENYLSGKDQTCELKQINSIRPTPIQKGYSISTPQHYGDENEKGLMLVGFIRKEYFNEIKQRLKQKSNNGLDQNGQGFVFYFYRKKDNFIYPIHPDISSLSANNKIIIVNSLYNDAKGYEIITGDIVGVLQSYEKENLKTALSFLGYHKEKFSAQSYYAFSVGNAEVKEISLQHRNELLAKIDAYPGNEALSKFSPKVIER